MDEVVIFRLGILNAAQVCLPLSKVICKHFYIVLDKTLESVVRFTQIAHLCGNIRI